jgi:hypothetical protein
MLCTQTGKSQVEIEWERSCPLRIGGRIRFSVESNCKLPATCGDPLWVTSPAWRATGDACAHREESHCTHGAPAPASGIGSCRRRVTPLHRVLCRGATAIGRRRHPLPQLSHYARSRLTRPRISSTPHRSTTSRIPRRRHHGLQRPVVRHLRRRDGIEARIGRRIGRHRGDELRHLGVELHPVPRCRSPASGRGHCRRTIHWWSCGRWCPTVRPGDRCRSAGTRVAGR